MNFFKKSIVGIDFNDYYAQLVELSLKNDQIILESYNRTILDPGIIQNGEIVDQEKFKISLLDLFGKANPKPVQSKNIAIIFPSAKVFTHIFKFPKTLEAKEIKKALTFEAETIIPFSINDVYWDFSILESDKKSKYTLFVAIIKETADRYTELLEAIDVSPVIFGVDVEALKYAIIKQLQPADKALVIDIGALATNYLVIQNNLIKHFFGTSKGGIDLIKSLSKEFSEPVEEILKEKEQNKLDKKYSPKITEFLEKNYKIATKIIQDFGDINRVILTGQFINLPNFYPLAEKYFSIEHLSVGDPRYYLTIESAKFKPFTNNKETAIYSTYFINAVGIALRGLLDAPQAGINLLPDRLKIKIKEKKHTLLIAISSVLMSAVSLFLATFMFFKFQDLSYQRKVLEIQKSQIDKILYGTRYQEIKEEILNFNNEVNSLSVIDSSLFSIPLTLEDIFKLIPKGIKITNFKVNDEKLIIELTGIADTRENLLKTAQSLKNAKFIKEVITPISNYDQKSQISFVIELKLNFPELKKYGTSATKSSQQ